jgi:hypothetical protein
VDEVMRVVKGSSEETQVDRFHPLSVRMGVAGILNLLGNAALSRRTNDQED